MKLLRLALEPAALRWLGTQPRDCKVHEHVQGVDRARRWRKALDIRAKWPYASLDAGNTLVIGVYRIVFVITDSRIGKSASSCQVDGSFPCVEACPVDGIHAFERDTRLYVIRQLIP